MSERIEKASFKAKLAGTAIDFGFIADRQEFFEFLVDNEFLEYGKFVEQRIGRPFHAYMVNKDVNYSSSWIQQHDEICQHKVGVGGSMLVDEAYRSIGYKSQVGYE